MSLGDEVKSVFLLLGDFTCLGQICHDRKFNLKKLDLQYETY